MKIIRENFEISSPLAIVFLMVLSFLVAWFTLSEGEKVLSDSEKFLMVDIQKKSEVENLNLQVR